MSRVILALFLITFCLASMASGATDVQKRACGKTLMVRLLSICGELTCQGSEQFAVQACAMGVSDAALASICCPQ